MLTAELIQQTEGRFAQRQAIRGEHEERIRAGALLEADTPDRVRKRVQHVARMVIETEGVGLPAPGQAPGPAISALERIMGKSDLMSVRYFELGLRVARTVGRVHVRASDGSPQGYGTGFLVTPRLLLTNNHVLTDAGVAGASRVEFDFQEGADGKLQSSILVSFDPATFFATDKGLDFSLVALKGDLRKIAPYGWNGLSAAEGKIIVGEYVSIIQHPSGERKQLALRENQVVDVLDNFLHYVTDTSPGSSGSPVFNDQWEIVALHHSGVPKKDAQGRILAKDGKVWTKSMGEHQISWIANEGVRISRILKHLGGLSLSGNQATLRKQLLDSEKGWQAGSAASKEHLGLNEIGMESAGNLWTLPLQLTIDVGRGVSGVGISAAAMPSAESRLEPPEPADAVGVGHKVSEGELTNAFPALESAATNGATTTGAIPFGAMPGTMPAGAAPESAAEWLLS